MTPKEHIDLWVQGNSMHNLELNQCLPDLSCCKKSLKWPKSLREDYRDAGPDVRETLNVRGLEAALVGAGFTIEDLQTVQMSINDLHAP